MFGLFAFEKIKEAHQINIM